MEIELGASAGLTAARASKEVDIAIDRLIYFAGWADKYQQVFGSVNPVASSHFNFTTPEPTGVVAILCPDSPPLVPLDSASGRPHIPGYSLIPSYFA